MNSEQIQWIAEQSYWVDSGRDDKPYVPQQGETYYYNEKDRKLGQFKVLETHDNEDGNGMQAMAIAPIDSKTGKVDISQVVVAYAGTNFDDKLDVLTDTNTVIGGNLSIDVSEWWATTNIIDGQAVSAMKFANQVKKKYGDSIITTTGHSLGEFLALYIAAENQWMNVGFNGPDPYNILSKEAKVWVAKNPGMLINFRNRGDILGNFGGNKTGAEIMISMDMGITNPLDYHGLREWKFDKEGNLIIPKNGYNNKAIQEQTEKYLIRQFVIGMYTLEVLKSKFKSSGGGISMNEQIYLDDSQALAVVQYASSEFETVMIHTVKIYQDGIRDLEKLWRETKSKAFSDVPDLSYSEVMDVLESTGATERSIVTEPSENFKEKIQKAKRMSEQFNQLTSEIKGKIAELVQRDQDLAKQLG